MKLFSTVLLVVLSVTLLPSPANKKDRAISYIVEAREIHQKWVESLERCGKDCTVVEEVVGTVEYHKEWIRRYNIVLGVLVDK